MPANNNKETVRNAKTATTTTKPSVEPFYWGQWQTTNNSHLQLFEYDMWQTEGERQTNKEKQQRAKGKAWKTRGVNGTNHTQVLEKNIRNIQVRKSNFIVFKISNHRKPFQRIQMLFKYIHN